MATNLTQFAQRKLARKTSDITRLTDAYKAQVGAISDQYQNSFAEYQKKRDEVMAPFNAATDKYKADFATYETNLAGYKDRLSDYQKRLQDAVDSPLERIDSATVQNFRGGSRVNIDGTWYGVSQLPDGYTYENGKLYQKRNPGKFDEKAPTAPEAPTAPTVENFDTTQFDQQRAALETNFQRDVSQRRAARASAVSRKMARPLLQGA